MLLVLVAAVIGGTGLTSGGAARISRRPFSSGIGPEYAGALGGCSPRRRPQAVWKGRHHPREGRWPAVHPRPDPVLTPVILSWLVIPFGQTHAHQDDVG